ncbi:ABC transporter substrate-binding protein [Jiella pelagia]|uniref:ABC transporter substrate-binding protein n=1 Tax=Jiella pelagia TaxID=2986949 RepID=A0ABY7BWQ3_9HYPH|nr:ABC transporter substrate-binding protein [Jiella pelagia]WAP68272.1 ABC transporter substrate-binding protein [Jiella pelagia]
MLSALAAVLLASGAANADTIKVGVIGPLSGSYSLYGQNFQWGIQAYAEANGTSVDGHEIEFVYRDLPGVDPAKARALAQELIVRDGVQYLAGTYFTPNALAIAPLLEQGNVPFVVLNAATSSIVEQSPYILRTSFTMWQNTVPAAKVAVENGSKKSITVVSDYGPGIDAETAFKTTYEEGGGEVVDTLRIPLSTTDFNPIAQRIKQSGADTVFAFFPAGAPTLGFMKAYIGNGLKDDGVGLISTGDLLTEPDLPALGDVALGMQSTYHYSADHDSPENAAFMTALEAIGADTSKVTMAAVAAFDGAKLIYEMIDATDGEQDPQTAVDAVKGMSWTSPRGPVSIDPETRHITQNVYLREVAKDGDGYVNKEMRTFEAQPDWGLAQK